MRWHLRLSTRGRIVVPKGYRRASRVDRMHPMPEGAVAYNDTEPHWRPADSRRWTCYQDGWQRWVFAVPTGRTGEASP